MDDDKLTIASWIEPYLPIIAAVVRGLVQIASGLGFAWALTVNGSQIQMAASAIAMLLTLGWSSWQKVQAVKAARIAEVAAARASAAAGKPVTVVVTPDSLPNTVKPVTRAELATVPTVSAAEIKRVVGEDK